MDNYIHSSLPLFYALGKTTTAVKSNFQCLYSLMELGVYNLKPSDNPLPLCYCTMSLILFAANCFKEMSTLAASYFPILSDLFHLPGFSNQAVPSPSLKLLSTPSQVNSVLPKPIVNSQFSSISGIWQESHFSTFSHLAPRIWHCWISSFCSACSFSVSFANSLTSSLIF